jgi:hypothetical protein
MISKRETARIKTEHRSESQKLADIGCQQQLGGFATAVESPWYVVLNEGFAILRNEIHFPGIRLLKTIVQEYLHPGPFC